MNGVEKEQRAEGAQTRVPHELMERVRLAAFVVLFGLLAAFLYFVISGVDFCGLAAVGLPGVSLIMFLSSATVLLPAPGIAAVGLAGAAWNPLLVGVFAAVGSSAGEMVGYLVGLGGRKALGTPSGKWWSRGEYVMSRWGFLFVLALAAIPNPAFDVVGILAGSLGYSARKLVVAIFIGNLLKYSAAAALGDFAFGERGC